MAMYDVSGACDMHIHTGPDFVERVGDDTEVAEACKTAGFRAILLKNHMESTVSRAYHTKKQVPGIQVYGSLVLNVTVGGINPVAAEAAMKMGAKEVFMPTFCSKADFAVHGKGQETLYKYGLKTAIEPYGILDMEGNLIPAVGQILELSRDYQVPIGTSHLGVDEIVPLCRLAQDIGATVIITHPEYKVPMLAPEQIAELTELGAVIEMTAGAVFPIPGCSTIDHDIRLIQAAGVENCFVSSDAGTPTKPMPAEVLSSYLYCLQKRGMDSGALNRMFRDAPAAIFGLN